MADAARAEMQEVGAESVALDEDLPKKRRERPPPKPPPEPPPEAPPPKSRALWCPSCLSFSHEKYPLHPIAGALGEYHCDRCDNDYVRNAKGELVLVHPGEVIPELCPYCHEEIYEDEKSTPIGVVYRLYCVNRNCPRGPGHTQPWFIDLSDRDYQQWLELRKRRKLEGIERLKTDMRNQGYDIDNPKSGKEWSIKREMDRITANVNKHGITDVFLKRLGIDKATARSQYGLDPDESKHFSENAQKALRESLGREEKGGEKFLTEEQRAKKDSYDQYKSKEKAMSKFFRGIGEHTERTAFSLILALIGLVVGAMFGWPFLVGFACWAGMNILPNPKPIKLVKNWEGQPWHMGSLLASGKGYDNRYSTGIAATKSLLKIFMLFFFGWGFFATELPFRGILLLGFCFAAYFSLPGEYSTEEAYKFMEGLIRIPVAILLAFVFLVIFKSIELGWLSLAFFAILPIAAEKENLARAIGHAGSGVSANYEMFDKIIFVVLMVFGLISVMGGVGLNLDIGTLAGNVFLPFWIICLIGGITSPAQVRPYTGVLMLIVVFVFYSAGAGEQIVGQGFFGAWWPTVHNAVSTITEPLGELFGTLGNTFGQTFLLLTNPMGFAQQIMVGTYEPNPHGPTGAFGVEIENLQVPAIYPGTTAMMTLNIHDVGPEDGKMVEVKVEVPDNLKDVITIGNGGTYNTDEIEKGFIIPLFFTLDTDCDRIMKSGVISRLSDRNMYIRVNVSVEYDYEVSSWMPLTVISDQEWRDRSAKGTFTLSKVPSHISTSPVKLSIGSFDQPLIAGERPFYLGFNLTSAEGKKSAIIWEYVKITLDYPKELEKVGATGEDPKCTIKPTTRGPPHVWEGLEYNRGQAIFCTFASTPDPGGPTKTYYVRGNATFRFKKWETKDTLFAFSDVCQEPSVVPFDDSGIGNIEYNIDETTSGVTIKWQTKDPTSDNHVLYKRSEDSSWRSAMEPASTEPKKKHSLLLPSLDLRTKYDFKVKSDGKERSGGSFTTAGCTKLSDSSCKVTYSSKCQWQSDTCYLRITAINDALERTTNEVTVTWMSSIPADSMVSYKKSADTSYTSVTGTGGISTDHSVILKSLDLDTDYEYKVKSETREETGGTFKTAICNDLSEEVCTRDYSDVCKVISHGCMPK